MKQTLTAKIHLYPDDNKKEKIDELMDTYRIACNYVSGYIFKHHETDYNTLHKALYRDVKERFELNSCMVQEAIKTTKSAYLSMRTNRHPWTRACFKRPQCSFTNQNYRLKITEHMLYITTLQKRIGIQYNAAGFERYLTGDYKLGTAKMIKKNNEYFFYIAATRLLDGNKKEKITNAVGVDVGIRNIAVYHNSFDETMTFGGKDIIDKRNHFVDLRSQLQKKGTKSAKRRLKTLNDKEHRWMEDVNHCIAKKIVEGQPKDSLIVLEDLKNMNKQTKCFHRKDRYACHSWAYHSLQQKITYKAEQKGQMVIKVPPFFTSSTCPICGDVDKTNRDQKKHIYICPKCGFEADDDVVAAMFIQRMGQSMIEKDS